MQKIVMIKDDPVIRDELALLLRNEGYQVLPITDFSDVLEQVQCARADLILLDLGLPGRDGFSLCADIQRTNPVPTIFVTSRDSAMNELRAFEANEDIGVQTPASCPSAAPAGALGRCTQ